MKLRDYQIEAIEKVFSEWEKYRKQLLVMPVGAGKTVTFGFIVKEFVKQGKKALVLAHREELIEQAAQKLLKIVGSGEVSIEKGSSYADFSANVVVGSVQTMKGERLRRWRRNHFDLIVVDEAHHSLSSSWIDLLNYFEFPKILGVTATPFRGDEKQLGTFYENIPYRISLIELIEKKYLAPIFIKTIPISIDLSNVKTTEGDLDKEELGFTLDPYLESICKKIKENIGERKTLIFLPLIKTSKRMTSILNSIGLKAVHVDGENRDGLNQFEKGEAQICCNSMLLTEGYDFPEISCVIVLRPTRSITLYHQMIGRGTRIHDNKDNLLLLDFLWNYPKLLCNPSSLIARTESEYKELTEKIRKETTKEINLFEIKRNVTLEREKKLAEILRRKKQAHQKEISLIEYAICLNNSEIENYEPTLSWHALPATTKQIELLKKLHFPIEYVKNRGHANFILNIFFERRRRGLASPNQILWLIRLGHFIDPDKITKNEASQILEQYFGQKNKKEKKPIFEGRLL